MQKFFRRFARLTPMSWLLCLAFAQAAFTQSPDDIAGYSVTSTFKDAAQVLDANGRFVHLPGNKLTITLTPFLKPTGDGDATPADSFNLKATIIKDTGTAIFIRFDASGVCSVLFSNNAMAVCQTPPVGGTRPLTEQEKTLITWDNTAIDNFFSRLQSETPEVRRQNAQFVAQFPSTRVPGFLSALADEFGDDAEWVIAARKQWEDTRALIGFDTTGLNKKLFAAVRDGDQKSALAALADGASIHATSDTSETPLDIAIGNSDAVMVDTLIQNGANTEWSNVLSLPIEGNDAAAILRTLATAEMSQREAQAARLADDVANRAERVTVLEDRITKLSAHNQQLQNELDVEQAKLRARLVDLQALLAGLKERDARTSEELRKLTEDFLALRRKHSIVDERLYQAQTSISALESFVDATGPDVIDFVQNRLIEFGYDPGEADGKLGTKTREAIATFQRAAKLPATGEITPQLITMLAAASDG